MYRNYRYSIFVFALVLSLAACSGRKAEEETTEQPVTRLPTNIPTVTTQSTDTNLNSDLFATTTTSDLQPVNVSTTSSNTVSSTTQMCLNGTQATSTNSSLQAVCYDTNAQYRSDLDLYNMGLGSFGSLDACVSFVRNNVQTFCSAQTLVATDQAAKMQAARMALVRCFRRVLMEQMRFAQWQPEIKQNYNYNDTLLFLLLQLFSNNS